MLKNYKIICRKSQIIQNTIPNLKPSQIKHSEVKDDWINAINDSYPVSPTANIDKEGGKWILKFDNDSESDKLDKAWGIVLEGLQKGILFKAEVSPINEHHQQQIIYVYNPSFNNKIEIANMFNYLIERGINTKNIYGYVKNINKHNYINEYPLNIPKMQKLEAILNNYKNNLDLAYELKKETEDMITTLENENVGFMAQAKQIYDGNVKQEKIDALKFLIKLLSPTDTIITGNICICKVSEIIAIVRRSFKRIDEGENSRTKHLLDSYVDASNNNLASTQQVNSSTISLRK